MASVTQYLANALGKWNQKQRGSDGSAHSRPIPGTGETTKNRYNVPDETYVEATNSCTWTAAENVTEMYITLVSSDAAAQNDDQHGWVVFDAVDSASAVLLLAEAGGAALDVQKYPLVFGRNGPFTGTSYFTRMDVDILAGTATTAIMFVEAQ